MSLRALVFLTLLLLLSTPIAAAQGGEGQPTPEANQTAVPKVHIVQAGETLTTIAAFYNTTVEAILAANNLSSPDVIYAGQSLVIPGSVGEVVPAAYTVAVGDTVTGLAAAFNTTPTAIAAANHLIADGNLVAGQSLNITSRTGSAEPRPPTGRPHVVAPGETFLLMAARYGLSPAALAAANDLSYPYRVFPGQRLRIPAETPYQFLLDEWAAIRVHPLPAVQGETVSIYVENLLPGQPAGTFATRPLHFVPWQEGYVALAGTDPLTQPGVVPLELGGAGDQPWLTFAQPVQLAVGGYITEAITVPQERADLLAPEIRAEEDAFLETIYAQFTDTPLWQGVFQMPVTTTLISSAYGSLRSYNGGDFSVFHTGLDFPAGIGTPVLAPAGGTAVFSGTLELRGNVLIVDHGLGVMTGYYHLQRILVQPGEAVAAGQPIAESGNTGLSSGAHLHWDLRILNVPVNPLQWTREIFP